MSTRHLTTLVIMLACGCLDPEPGFYSCAEDTGCPDDWFCHSDDRCRPEAEAASDMGPLADAAMDLGPDLGERDLGPVDADACVAVPQRPVDLLLVVDDSGSMADEQARLKDSVRGLLEALALGRDASGATGAFAPVVDLHVGVITTDIGAGTASVGGPSCTFPGDDGILLNESRAGGEDCSETFDPRYLAYDPSVGINALADDLTCLASVGLTGCGFEQQLEAMARALVPSATGAIDRGKADGPNGGFLREGSVLVVSVVTDESDCSAEDLDLFDPVSATYTGDLNRRCGDYAETALHDVGRYVDALLTYVRGTRDTDVIFAPLVGVPPSLVDSDWDTILADDSQQFVPRPDGLTFVAACESTGTSAQPAPRFVELAKELEAQGGHATLGSICDQDYGGYFDGILAELEPLLESANCGP